MASAAFGVGACLSLNVDVSSSSVRCQTLLDATAPGLLQDDCMLDC